MLLLKTKWKEGRNFIDIEYDTPVEKCRNKYYNLTLDYLYSTASETDTNIQLTLTVSCAQLTDPQG